MFGLILKDILPFKKSIIFLFLLSTFLVPLLNSYMAIPGDVDVKLGVLIITLLICYIFIFSLFALDEKDKLDSIYISFPFTRLQIVIFRYITFSIVLISILIWCFIDETLLSTFGIINYDINNNIYYVAFYISSLFAMVVFPIYLKYGSTIGQKVMIFVFVGMCFVPAFISRVLINNMIFKSLYEKFSQTDNKYFIIGFGSLFFLTCLSISVLISYKNYNKRDF